MTLTQTCDLNRWTGENYLSTEQLRHYQGKLAYEMDSADYPTACDRCQA